MESFLGSYDVDSGLTVFTFYYNIDCSLLSFYLISNLLCYKFIFVLLSSFKVTCLWLFVYFLKVRRCGLWCTYVILILLQAGSCKNINCLIKKHWFTEKLQSKNNIIKPSKTILSINVIMCKLAKSRLWGLCDPYKRN